MNASFERQLQSELDALKAAGTYKHLRHITTPMAAEVHMEEAGDVIVLSSNNYLGLSDQAEVIAAGVEGLEKYGAGTASVRFICGTFDIHRTLEKRIAEFLGTEASLTYVACWNANTGLFATICGEGSAIISDELNHASIIDGVRLASKAKRAVYKHGDMADLEQKLKDAQGLSPVLVVTDGVFSMEGSLAKLPEIVALCKKYNAVSVVDDSHGTGVMGKTGRGTIEHFGLSGEVDIITGTLGKALGGAAGGFVAGTNALIEMLIQKSRPQLFSNALPATVACSSLAALDYLDAHPQLVDTLRDNVAYFREGLKKLGFKPLDGPSAIVPIIVGETAFAISMSDKLLKKGVFVTGFGFPVVPEGTARIRTQLSSKLTKDEMDRALSAFESVGKEAGLL
ncbi:MAG TPA: glycine C-acetyltransferase [Candidatus Baltobacteraceae bacterium]|nr:glycine C-acetyltransferase [Candidatus Baltobacteraceae bacterium]